MPSEFVQVNPNALKRIREISGYDPEKVAKKLNIPLPKFYKIENEGKIPKTYLKKLAEIYKVPIVAFFSEKIPDLPLLVDYRINREKKLTQEVFLAIRRAKYLSEEIREISGKESTIPELKTKSPREMAEEFRKYLGLELIKGISASDILENYKEAVENRLNIIIFEYPLGEDVRAFSLYSKLAVIVLNESDEPSVKLFSLFHELAHLLRKESGICSIDFEFEEEVEKFCNKFSAEFLVPKSDLTIEIESSKLDDKDIKRLAKKYGVSVQVIMLRLLELGKITTERYKEFKKAFQKHKKIKGKNWERTFINRNGKLAIAEVSRAYKNGEISLYEALRILDLKVKYAEKIFDSF